VVIHVVDYLDGGEPSVLDPQQQFERLVRVVAFQRDRLHGWARSYRRTRSTLAIQDPTEPAAPPRRTRESNLLAKFVDPGKLNRQEELQDLALAFGERPKSSRKW
jgi:hypothetical protein